MSKQYDYNSRFEELQSGIDTTFRTILEPFVYDNISKYHNLSAKILDVGCGCGFLTTQIAKRFASATVEGLDIATEAIECARKYSDLNFIVSDVLDFKAEQAYDILVYNMVLHNIEHIPPTLNRSYELLNRNGILIITIPHPCFWLKDKLDRGKIVLEEVFSYAEERRYLIPFQITNGAKHQSFLHYYHRTLATYLNMFTACLFDVKVFEEVDTKNGLPTMLRMVLHKKQ